MLPTEHASTAGLLGGYSRVRTGHSFRGRLNEKVGGRQAVWPKGCGECISEVMTSGDRLLRLEAPQGAYKWFLADFCTMTDTLRTAGLPS